VQSPEALDDQSPDPEHDPGSVSPWQREYAAFIAAYNAKIKEEGLSLEAWRAF
jgi:N-acetyl-anhydromuramyl-L-alanine amidase AmpD